MMRISIILLQMALNGIFSLAFSQHSDEYSASFIATWAGDTASIETFTIRGNHLFGKAIHLYPEAHMKNFNIFYNENGSIRHMDFQFYNLDHTALPLQSKTNLPYSVHMSFSDGVLNSYSCSATDILQYIHKASRADFNGGWIPIMGQWEWLTARWSNGKLDSNLIFVNYVLGPYDLSLNAVDDTTLVFSSEINASITFTLNGEKRIKYIDAIGSPWNYVIKKTDPIYLDLYTKNFAQKPTIGYPSPREKIKVTAAGIDFLVTYGSPRKRGRKIFGEIVPLNQIWRTGAGPATKMSFDQDLTFGQTQIPKGSYNLYTVPGIDSWRLIFNTEENAWGSAHRSAYDFASVTMRSFTTSHVFEAFTISISETPEGGLLQLKWDQTIAEIDFRKKSQ